LLTLNLYIFIIRALLNESLRISTLADYAGNYKDIHFYTSISLSIV